MAGAREMVQLIKYLPCKHKDPKLSLSAVLLPPPQKKAKLPVVVCACIPSARKNGADPWLAAQPTKLA